MIFIVFLTFPRRKIFHYSDAQDRYTENEFIRKGDDGSRKTQEEKTKTNNPEQKPKNVIGSAGAGKEKQHDTTRTRNQMRIIREKT